MVNGQTGNGHMGNGQMGNGQMGGATDATAGARSRGSGLVRSQKTMASLACILRVTARRFANQVTTSEPLLDPCSVTPRPCSVPETTHRGLRGWAATRPATIALRSIRLSLVWAGPLLQCFECFECCMHCCDDAAPDTARYSLARYVNGVVATVSCLAVCLGELLTCR